jgi:fructose-bisphosphate aldolase class I
VTEGLDGQRERLDEYRGLGARFAEWRAVIAIGDGRPSAACLDANAHALARYAALCQAEGLVPIVEPEVLMDGDHALERCFRSPRRPSPASSARCGTRASSSSALLKPNMVVPGARHPHQASVDAVAEATVRCLRRTVPAAVPGIVFLSGGQDAREATAHLNP